jgi:hypothetical protein
LKYQGGEIMWNSADDVYFSNDHCKKCDPMKEEDGKEWLRV